MRWRKSKLARSSSAGDFVILWFTQQRRCASRRKGYESRLLNRFKKLRLFRVLTATVAAMEAFRDLGASRLAVVDPYPPDLNAEMAEYLGQWGFSVESVVSLGTAFTRSSVAFVADIYQAARKATKEAQNADGHFYSMQEFSGP